MNYEDIIKLIQVKGDEETKSNIPDSKEYDYKNHIESYYNSIVSSLINKLKSDNGNYDELFNISSIKKDILNESRKQYKIIISYCKDSEINNIKVALRKYNFLHLLKFVNKILDLDEDYNIKLNECKQYFSNKEDINILKYLYTHSEVTHIELKQITGTDLAFPSHISDLIIIEEKNNSQIYSLSPKGKNLYAFFMMKNIDTNVVDANYNEGKVNEVLEYLIQYVLTQQNKEKQNRLKKPKLNSISANYNLNKLTSILDNENSYSHDFIQNFTDIESESYNWAGGKTWKIY